MGKVIKLPTPKDRVMNNLDKTIEDMAKRIGAHRDDSVECMQTEAHKALEQYFDGLEFGFGLSLPSDLDRELITSITDQVNAGLGKTQSSFGASMGQMFYEIIFLREQVRILKSELGIE